MKSDNYIDPGDERRGYFRVNDVIPVVATPVDITQISDREDLKKALRSSKGYSLLDLENDEEEDSDAQYNESEDNKTHKMMKEIQTKLNFIINHLMLEKEGFLPEDRKMVNISASGIRFTVDKPAKENDIMEVKMLLPTSPPVVVFAYGEVKRVIELGDGKCEVALEYLNMGDSVKSEIVQYALNNQRESIKRAKESQMNE